MNGLYSAKAWYTHRLEAVILLADRWHVSPDAFTCAGVAAAVIAAVAFVAACPLVVAVAVVGRLAGANLDGAVARRRGVSRPFGFVVNEIGDRASDTVLLAGVAAAAALTRDTAAIIATVAALALSPWPTLVSVSGAAAGGTRVNGGPFGKTERCAAVVAASVAMGLGTDPATTITVLGTAVTIGSAVTAVTRAVAVRRELRGLPHRPQ